MNASIELVKSEVAWHKKHFKDGPSLAYEIAFIAGLEHVLELLLRVNKKSEPERPPDSSKRPGKRVGRRVG